MVISFDTPVSYTYPNQKNQFILDETCEDPFVKWCIDNKENAVEAFHFSRDAAMKLYKDGLTTVYFLQHQPLSVFYGDINGKSIFDALFNLILTAMMQQEWLACLKKE